MFQLPNGKLRTSQFAIFSDNTEQWPNHFDILQKRLFQTFNLKNEDIKSSDYWICVRPLSPDDLPLIGRLKGRNNNFKNLYLNIGHGSRGSILSFGSAQLLVNILNKQKTESINQEDYAPGRFDWI